MKKLKTDLLITCFKGLTQAEEAEIFVDVNGEQKSQCSAYGRNTSLAWKTFSWSKAIKIICSILTNLRDNGDSPFKDLRQYQR